MLYHATFYRATTGTFIGHLPMRRFNVRVPDALLAEIEAEARKRKLSKSEVVREGLSGAGYSEYSAQPRPATVGHRPADLKAKSKGISE